MKRLLSSFALLASVVSGSELRETIERYDADRRAVGHPYHVCPAGRGSRHFGECFAEPSDARRARLRTFYQDSLDHLKEVDFD